MKTVRILVVEDVSTMRNFIKAAIELNFRNAFVETVGNGDLAKQILEKDAFDVVLCDWELPLMKGDELLQWIRSTDAVKGMSFVMVTGKTQKDDVLRAKELGADGYIVKPVTVGVLVAKLAEISSDLARV